MSGSVFGSHWYRVAELHPRLRSHVQVDRHCYRGEVWHVLKNPFSGRLHRVNEAAYRIVGRLDGRLALQQIWDLAVAEAGDDAPTQSETIALLAQLHAAELIETEANTDITSVFRARDARQQQQRAQQFNPLSFCIPLLDPTRVLDVMLPASRLLLNRWVLLGWAIAVAVALVQIGAAWGELSAYASVHLLSPRSLLIMWLCYPLIKFVHECAHAIAIRAWGGAVTEMGVTVTCLVPVPYVDASSASAFRDKRRRVLVSLMGILVETALAAGAAAVWLTAADGLVREAAFAVMLIGGVSTVLVNGNPLMRFDAYHALADALELPGLGARGAAWLRYLSGRYLLGARVQPPAATSGERAWLIGYACASLLYRVVGTVALLGWLLDKSLVLAAVVAAWLGTMVLVKPLRALLLHLVRAPELDGRRRRAGAVLATGVALTAGLLFGVPLPRSTHAHGVIWLPDQAGVRNETEGFVERLLVRDGMRVTAGQPLLVLQEPSLLAERDRLLARLQALDASYQIALVSSAAEVRSVAEGIGRTQADLKRIDEQLGHLVVTSPATGRLSLPRQRDLAGRFLPKGTVVAHVLDAEDVRVRVVVPQSGAALVQQHTQAIEVRAADAAWTVMGAQLLGDVPAATRDLPSAALRDRGGGATPTDPADPQASRAREAIFLVDLEVPGQLIERIGARVRVRFDHGSEVLAQQWARRVRQTFIRHLGSEQPGLEPAR